MYLILSMLIVLNVSPKPTVVNNRQVLNYELKSIALTKSSIRLSGWAFLMDAQHFKDKNTHDISIIVKGKGETHRFKTKLLSESFTKHMSYNGYRMCADNELNKKHCNYHYNAVGFEVEIPTHKFSYNDNYEFFIEVYGKKVKRRVQSPLYTPLIDVKRVIDGQAQITLTSRFKYEGFKIAYHTLIAMTSAHHTSEMPNNRLSTQQSCATQNKNTTYYILGDLFTKIESVVLNKITYFKAKVNPARCSSGLQRIKFASKGKHTVYVPSTFVTFLGKPLTWKKIYISKEHLSASDIVLNQYDTYDIYQSVSAKIDNVVHPKPTVVSNTVNTWISGVYQTCYRFGKLNACRKVTVKPVKTIMRFVNKSALNLEVFTLWDKKLNLIDLLIKMMD